MLMTRDTPSEPGHVDAVSVALTVIVPAYNCPLVLRQCLDGLRASDLPRERWELIVVDDSSTDNTADVARSLADVVLTTKHGPNGPGDARNLGAAVASASILLFVDADVVVAPGTLSGFLRIFNAQPSVTSVFGAYDDRPSHESFLSQYRNLLHHYVHCENPGSASTFWAGCGAVRRAEFLEVGGFDTTRYPRPQIEDIELGYRLVDRGYRIVLAPELQAKHLKQWTLPNMVRTDLRDRAVPWMTLLIERQEIASNGPLNLQSKEKMLTAIAGAAVACFGIAITTTNSLWLLGTILGTAGVVLGNAKLLIWFRRQRGMIFALRVIPARMLFYIISGTGAAWAILGHSFRNPRRSHREAASRS